MVKNIENLAIAGHTKIWVERRGKKIPILDRRNTIEVHALEYLSDCMVSQPILGPSISFLFPFAGVGPGSLEGRGDGIISFNNNGWFTMRTIAETPINTFAKRWKGERVFIGSTQVTNFQLVANFQEDANRDIFATQNVQDFSVVADDKVIADWELYLT